jgi:hypothetical protein
MKARFIRKSDKDVLIKLPHFSAKYVSFTTDGMQLEALLSWFSMEDEDFLRRQDAAGVPDNAPGCGGSLVPIIAIEGGLVENEVFFLKFGH